MPIYKPSGSWAAERMESDVSDVSVKVELNATEIWPDPSWDGWRDAWVVANDAYSTDEKKARGLVAAVNAYIAAGAPEVILPAGDDMPPEYFEHIDLWEIADDVWAWNEATAFIAVRALSWWESMSRDAKAATGLQSYSTL